MSEHTNERSTVQARLEDGRLVITGINVTMMVPEDVGITVEVPVTREPQDNSEGPIEELWDAYIDTETGELVQFYQDGSTYLLRGGAEIEPDILDCNEDAVRIIGDHVADAVAAFLAARRAESSTK